MNIKRAKQEIKDTIAAYLAKDAFGGYRIPAIRQRPVLLMGPPGIGKTQIMEQIAKEMGIGLVAYTITHHTRQSAVGLPFIRERVYGGKTYSVQLCIGDAGACDASVPSGEDLRQSEASGGVDHRGSGKSAGV